MDSKHSTISKILNGEESSRYYFPDHLITSDLAHFNFAQLHQ